MIPVDFFNQPKRLHFIGILGHGMSALAHFCLAKGHQVYGSDLRQNSYAQPLIHSGATIYFEHQEKNVYQSDVVIFSSAIDQNNPELVQALDLNILTVSRGELLAFFVNQYQYSIAVSGSHGKTSVVGLLSFLLTKSGLDPTYLMGGSFCSDEINAKVGSSDYCVSEGDESDQSFLFFKPKIGVILNLDDDHLSNYSGSFDKIKSAFFQFASQIDQKGCLIICADHPVLTDLLKNYQGNVITFGRNKQADIYASDEKYLQSGNELNICYYGQVLFPIQTKMHGQYSTQNLLAVCAILKALSIDLKKALSFLPEYLGIKRRFIRHSLMFNHLPIDLIDDYCHHPEEVKACLLTANQVYPNRRFVVIFEPHRYTRSAHLLEKFVEVLSNLPVLILLPTYSAGERFLTNGSSEFLYQAIRRTYPAGDVFYLHQKEKIVNLLERLIQKEDVLLMLGAGTIGNMAETFSTRGRY